MTNIQVTAKDLEVLLQSDPMAALKATNIALQRILSEKDAEIASLKKAMASFRGDDGAEGDLQAAAEVAYIAEARD